MWIAVLCGLATGAILNLGADLVPPASVPPARDTRVQRYRLARWGALLVLCAGLLVHLRSRWLAPASQTQQMAGLWTPLPGDWTLSWRWVAGTAREFAYCSLLLLIATIDLEHHLVPDVLILLGILLALGFSLLTHSPSLVDSLSGAAVGGGFFLILALARRDALGAGDVKLAFLIGMLTGFPWVVQALVLGILLGGVAAALLLLLRVRGPGQYIPYAPYLAAGGLASLLYGQRIAIWYARLAGFGG